jgi:octaprenyl-diphosphate synthase
MEQLDIIQKRIEPELKEMNDVIRKTLYTPNELMNRVVNNYLKGKGKQIRPMLVILSAKMFGEVSDDVIYAGAALEMLHNASLIHDDVIDETSLRRGRNTINCDWGNQIAVLTGDFFVSNALAAGIKTGHISIVSALSDLGKELSIGEIDQICNAREHHFDEDKYIDMIRKKTASLFLNCVRMGADAVNAAPDYYDALVRYAELLGLCFQIKDDIFDYYDVGKIGKPTGNDLREGKVSLPLIYAINNATDGRGEQMKELIYKGALSDEEIAILIEFAKDNGGIDYSFAYMRKLQQQAEKLISVYPDSVWKNTFRDIFEFIIGRDF